MREKQKTLYICELCKEEYPTKEEARSCESRPVKPAAVKPGDRVRILSGDGKGQIAKVVFLQVQSKYWGHYFWERYWHTVAVVADFENGCGSRLLTFDAYEKVQP